MKRPSKSQIEYMENKLAQVEEDRSRPVTQEDVERILAGLRSSDERVRADALREVCPCRMPWEVFEQLRKPALKLRKDPSELVRGRAEHIEEDRRELLELEALCERLMEREDEASDYAASR